MAKRSAAAGSELSVFAGQLRQLGNDGAWLIELAKVHKQVGERTAEWARYGAAGGGTRQQQTAIDRIKGRGDATKATIGVSAGGGTPYALGAFYGGKKRTGWFGGDRYVASTSRQFPVWVGASWEAGGPGGPYFVNAAIRDNIDDILDFYRKGIDKLASRAFPD